MDESAMMVEMTMNGDGDYMEQEEEWEREGLLDPAWEKQQRKVGILLIFIINPCLIQCISNVAMACPTRVQKRPFPVSLSFSSEKWLTDTDALRR